MVPPKAKPVELAPNAGLTGVPKLDAVVAAAAPNVKGAEAGADVDDVPMPANGNGFDDAAGELKADWAAGASNDGFPKVNEDWVVVVAAVVEVVLAKAKPPKEDVVVFWLGVA